MDFRNCNTCGQLFKYMGNRTCNNCIKKDEEDFKRVKEYLRENDGASLQEVVDATEVSSEKIMDYLRNDRLEIKGEGGYILECESCSKKIPSGRLCKDCLTSLESEIGKLNPREKDEVKKKDSGNKFRIIDRYR